MSSAVAVEKLRRNRHGEITSDGQVFAEVRCNRMVWSIFDGIDHVMALCNLSLVWDAFTKRECRLQTSIEFLVKVSIVEIYNERRNAELGQTHTCRFLLLRHSGFVGSEEGQLEKSTRTRPVHCEVRVVQQACAHARLGVSSSVKSPKRTLGRAHIEKSSTSSSRCQG